MRLELLRDVARDPVTGLTLWQGGSPVMVEGREAVRSWAIAALRTVRCRFPMFDADYGCELETLIGTVGDRGVLRAEVPRMVRDALTSPYISDVQVDNVDLDGSCLRIAVTINSVYGEVQVNYGA